MKIIAKPQCCGKTKELIAYSIEHNIPIFCLTQSKKASLREKAYAYFGQPVWVLCRGELLNAECTSVLIDDAENLLLELVNDYSTVPVDVVGFTVTTEIQFLKIASF